MDIASDRRLMSNDSLCFTETEIQQTQSDTNDLNLVLNGFNIYFNNNQNKFMSLAYGLHNTISVTEEEDFPGISIVNLKRWHFLKKALNQMILYKGYGQTLATFYEYLLYFIGAKSLDMIVGDFNIDACNQSKL